MGSHWGIGDDFDYDFSPQDNEMLAFSPGVAPPGLAPSDDKLLQSRIQSYSDAQVNLLGTSRGAPNPKARRSGNTCALVFAALALS